MLSFLLISFQAKPQVAIYHLCVQVYLSVALRQFLP